MLLVLIALLARVALLLRLVALLRLGALFVFGALVGRGVLVLLVPVEPVLERRLRAVLEPLVVGAALGVLVLGALLRRSRLRVLLRVGREERRTLIVCLSLFEWAKD